MSIDDLPGPAVVIAATSRRSTAELSPIQLIDSSVTQGPPGSAAPRGNDRAPDESRRGSSRVRSRRWSLPQIGSTVRHLGWVSVGALAALAWVRRNRLDDLPVGAWLLALAVVAVVVAVRVRPRPPKSAAHPAMQLRRSRHWSYRPVLRPLGRRSDVANVFVDADSFAAAAWPGADLDVARRWTLDASARVASRFGTNIAVLVGSGSPDLPDRDGVQVVRVPDDGTIADALWQVVAPVDPSLMMLFVTDADDSAIAATAHGAQVMPCRSWMTLADR